jgi:leucyl aminopeptidase
MSNLNKVVGTAKKLIDLPYNRFNLENYFKILEKNNFDVAFTECKDNLPIKLMSGNHSNAGIIACNHPKTLSQIDKQNYKRRIYIIGKGILFDSGGMDIKLRGMADMTGDKAGMIIALSVANYLKENIVAYCPVTTNLINTSKIIPGDEIKIGKKIVRISNTDAEGRLILAEAISTLNASKNDIIITVATLTGACEYAIGGEATGVFANNEDLLKKYAEATFEAKSLAWGLPLWEHYQKQYYNKKIIENSIKNIKCGATEAALFIKQFIPYPNRWLHLDIAASAFDKKGKANGQPILALIKFINKLNEKIR